MPLVFQFHEFNISTFHLLVVEFHSQEAETLVSRCQQDDPPPFSLGPDKRERKPRPAHGTVLPWLLLMPLKGLEVTLSHVSASGKQARASPHRSPCLALRRSPQTAAFGGDAKGLGLPHSSQDKLAKALRLSENKSLIFLFARQLK